MQEAFIAEIERLKEAELSPGAETADFVFAEKDANLFDPKALTEVDRAIWEKVKNGTVTRDDLKKYKKDIPRLDEAVFFAAAKKGATMHDMIASIDVGARSRLMFDGFIINKATSIIRAHEGHTA